MSLFPSFTSNTSNFFSNQQQQKNEEDDFKISESMRLEDLPDSIAKQFIEVHKFICDNREFLENSKIDQKDKSPISNISNINYICNNDLFLNLDSLAHQIDSGRKMIKDFKTDLDEFKKNYNSTQSSFLVRYSKQLEDMSGSISEEIEAYKGHLQSLSNNSTINRCNSSSDYNDVLFNFFNEEYQALLRSSTKISRLSKKLSYTRALLCQKLKIDQSQFIIETKDVGSSVFQSIHTRYKQFQENKKSKLTKNISESDLFGLPTKIEATQTSVFGGGSGGFSFPTFNSTSGGFLTNRKDSNKIKTNLKINTNSSNNTAFPSLRQEPSAPKATENNNPFK
ncbi:hypothetical protein M9Y10_002259 [Tritrichomonas musculus]|uniref:Uncharacterized protein n=1 Tax=Tritrichomonas musculus TaxID=1915356 RepID=A0ABR2L998_9EUKA